jgi:hypothetical protein
MATIFEHLFVLGRPAGGKSEFLDMLQRLGNDERARRMQIGRMCTMDDFVWLWEKFEEDDIWEKVGKGRLHSNRSGHGYVLKRAALFNFLIAKLNHTIKFAYLKDADFYRDHTLLVEFSRGGEAPYQPALSRFDPAIMKRAAIIYVEVSREESLRRNEARYQEKLRHSILAHKTPDEDMKRFYADDDWPEITRGQKEGYVELSGIKVPFVTVHNEPEIKDPVELAKRYEPALSRLSQLVRR